MKIKIGQVHYEIKAVSEEEVKATGSTWGSVNFKKKVILINEKLHKEDYIKTAIHEVTHAMLFETQFIRPQDANKKIYSEEDLCMAMELLARPVIDIINKLEIK